MLAAVGGIGIVGIVVIVLVVLAVLYLLREACLTEDRRALTASARPSQRRILLSNTFWSPDRRHSPDWPPSPTLGVGPHDG